MTLEGCVAAIPHAHLVEPPRGKRHEYVDLGAPEAGQIVVYVADPLPRDARLRLTGTLIALEGPSKRPGGKRVTEIQLDVTRWEAL